MSKKPELSQDLESVRADLARLVVRDMKAPLAGLANLLEMADRASVKHFQDDASQYVNDALGATETLEELVELLMGVRKFMAGEGHPDKRARDLFSLARAISDGLSEAAQAAGGAIVVTGEPVTVSCDTDQISRVIRHLIRIAIKATGKGGTTTVQIGCHDSLACVSVECIPAKEGGDAPDAECLGLTYCRLVMEAHDGTFKTEAEPGKPYRWYCSFPEAKGMIPEAMETDAASSLEPSRRYLGAGSVSRSQEAGNSAASIVNRGTREQFGVAVALMSAIPLLAFAYLLGNALYDRSFDVRTLYMMLPSVVALVALGVVLLARHTLEVASLRLTLESMAKGELPRVSVKGGSADFLAIQSHLGTVIQQTNERVRVIEAQSKALVQAEQQRVMSETVGAACHHLGQPATVIRVYLDLMKKVEGSPEMKGMIQECQSAAEEVAEILHRLKGVGQYQTEPYLGADPAGKLRGDERILKI
jgi:signal transduction histidine kinase